MRSNDAGFTLVEVLIALAIVAVALGAAVRASGVIADNNVALRDKALALVSAENQLAGLRVAQAFPPPGKSTSPCAQGRQEMQCELTVSNTVNADLRQAVVRVYPADARDITLVSLGGLLARPRR